MTFFFEVGHRSVVLGILLAASAPALAQTPDAAAAPAVATLKPVAV